MFGNTTQSRPGRSHRTLAGTTIAGVVLGLVTVAPGVAFAAQRYKVESGDTLALIAEEFDIKGKDNWRRLYDANPKIDNPDLIIPGQKLVIPGPKERVKSRPLPQATVTTAPRTGSTTVSRSSTTTAPAAPAAPAAPSGSVWTRLAACESGGNWAANTGNGYYGGLQFSLSSWQAVGGTGYPHQASAATQIAMGQRLQAQQGWGAWPSCAAQLGL